MGSGLVAGFVLLAALLLGAALSLPLLLTWMMYLGRRFARGPLTEWFWADTRQQLPSLSLALMALLLALAANVGVGTMVSSFRLTFTGWLDQRLADPPKIVVCTVALQRLVLQIKGPVFVQLRQLIERRRTDDLRSTRFILLL